MNRAQWKLALIDLDGTLYRGDSVIPGAVEFLVRVRDNGIQPVFFTNNASKTPDQVASKLVQFGLEADPHEVCTSAQGAAAWIKSQVGQGAAVLYIGMEGLKEAIRSEGLEPVHVRDFTREQPFVRAAVVGLDTNVTYTDLAVFCDQVYRLGGFVLTNGDVRLPMDDRFWPGNGAIGAFVQTATGYEPIVTGKPATAFVEYAMSRFGASLEQTVIIGDNLLTDIAAGAAANVATIQVLTGVHYQADSPLIHPKLTPDEVVKSVDDLFR